MILDFATAPGDQGTRGLGLLKLARMCYTSLAHDRRCVKGKDVHPQERVLWFVLLVERCSRRR